MKKVFNDIIPFKTFTAMCLWPFVFVRNDEAWKFNDDVERHEGTHGCQQKELLVVGCILAVILYFCGCGWWSLTILPLFLWLYFTEWIVKLCYYRNANTAYKNISFEREAYANQNNIIYLKQRKPFAFIHYMMR